MDLKPICRRVIGPDVHQRQITACALIEDEDGQVQVLRREFGTFGRDRRARAERAHALAPGVVVMESSGICRKSPHAVLEQVGIVARVAGARHVKAVPGRKTDVADAQRLASRSGLCPGSNESAGKRKSGRTRRGNARVHRLLCECAQAAARTRCTLRDKFRSPGMRKGRKRSIAALAHKMLRIIHAMPATGTHHADKSVDHEAPSVARNAPRWLMMLRKHGCLEQPAGA